MDLITLIDRREQEAQKIAAARGRPLHWTGIYWVSQEDRATADEIVKAGLSLTEVGSA